MQVSFRTIQLTDGKKRVNGALRARAAVRPALRQGSAFLLGLAGGWAVLYGALMPFGLGLTLPAPARRLLRGLAALTYSFYLWHQMLTVFLKYDLHLPAWQGVTPPNQLGDKVWMHRADMLYWAAALTTGAAAYFLLEKPAASALHQIAQKMRAEKAR